MLISYGQKSESNDKSGENTIRYYIGGSVNFTINNNNATVLFTTSSGTIFISEVKQTRLSLRPNFGIQISDNFQLGFITNYARFDYKYSEAPNNDNTIHQLNLGIYTRYIFTNSFQLKPFVEPYISYFHSNSTNAAQQKRYGLGIGLDIGAQIYISDHWRLIMQFGAISSEVGKYTTSQSDESFSNLSFGIDLDSFRYGVEYVF